MKRNVIEINQDLCVGCSLCIKACHQGAIELINGKATLISDSYCDGLGMCLPKCPTNAIQIIEKETDAFLEERRGITKPKQHAGGGCPSSQARTIEVKEMVNNVRATTQLKQWPVQLNLVSPYAPYLEGANLLVCADCVPFAYANFHQDFLKDHVVVVGCPKLDNISHYQEKLMELIGSNQLRSIKVLKMEVPCCTGIATVTRNAYLQSGQNIPYSEITVNIDGTLSY